MRASSAAKRPVTTWRVPRLRTLLRRLQLAAYFSATADVVAGLALAGAWEQAPWLVLISALLCLHTGRVILDQGRMRRTRRARFRMRSLAMALFALGAAIALLAGPLSTALTVVLALLALVTYPRARHPALALLTDGAGRILQLLLGLSVVPAMVGANAQVILVLMLYLLAVASMRRPEDGPGHSLLLPLALLMAALVSLIATVRAPDVVVFALPFIALLAFRILPPFAYAAATADEAAIRHARRAGTLNLIVLDAALAAGFGGPWLGLGVLALLPVSLPLAPRSAI
jgi:hypothetical protein